MLIQYMATLSIRFAGTHLYTWVKIGTMGVKCLAQKHNTKSPARARSQTIRPRVKLPNQRATTHPY